jgi:hypothetical protein
MRTLKGGFTMLDPTTTRTDSLRDPDRWGYTGQMMEDPLPPIKESGGASRWLLWVALIAIAVIVLVALLGSPR